MATAGSVKLQQILRKTHLIARHQAAGFTARINDNGLFMPIIRGRIMCTASIANKTEEGAV
ncbi:hypothetical protein JCM17844_03300 [Iodidimonas gelatinilytica]|uniref:Uncharacterized protein n=1 Tax=Iodidimonas gelatinilytica TaxID=1236966 RepID=A0A5A7MZY8_9PROT|nr:hypothetical protein JCM17844_03300 [Iodidimonas gelatinilytica]GER01418.1 hypothetical protein JCM17845_20410 [Iodidimonas gelatinilytica]